MSKGNKVSSSKKDKLSLKKKKELVTDYVGSKR